MTNLIPPTTPAPAAAAAAEVPEDRDLLFTAVAGRLRQCVGEVPAAPVAVRDSLLDGAQALEQLQNALDAERDRVQRVEAELQAARFALVSTKAGERRAQHQALHDGLTQLPNRSCFQNRLADVLQGAANHNPSLAVLFIDLDGFKPINDRHGHATGDELLRIVAQRLTRSIRADDMVCRMGGDEFACLLSDPMGREQLSQLAAKLFDAVSAPLKVGELTLTVHPSIGIAVCPHDGNTAQALLERADSAMYQAKRRQSGYAFFDGHADA